ncbi:DNA binding domain protein, excisionase family [Ammonifex degensii KC4]|uniref:DNA binding domain protein, excisionase family n=1 Tax=Ammonifex degensii (strain DSM 10501 / KC4) TaxID=429009 RepID=C9RBB6_AMMDK|nr:IS607 family transposase [Ammonifex degensii]ACX51543.1 DNA binding domain protein, excisionase family [Ammonifex degensii KC4]
MLRYHKKRMYRIAEAAVLLGVHKDTLRRWEREGKIKAVWLGRERRFPEEEIRRLLGEANPDVVVLYARVSGHDQKANLQRQVEVLREAYGPKFSNVVVLTDVGSGLSTSRRGLRKAMELARERKIRAIAVTYPDRLTRFGFEYLEEYFSSFGVEVLVLNREEDKSLRQELVEDFLAIVTSFAGKLYGHRSHKVKKLKNEVKEALSRLDTDDRPETP